MNRPSHDVRQRQAASVGVVDGAVAATVPPHLAQLTVSVYHIDIQIINSFVVSRPPGEDSGTERF